MHNHCKLRRYIRFSETYTNLNTKIVVKNIDENVQDLYQKL